MEHYLLIADQDWTPNKDDSDDERWYYAAPGAVAALIARLQPHTKREQQSPTRFREFSGAIFATWPTDEDLQALRTRLDPYRILATPAALAQATSPVAKEYLRSHQPFTSPTDDQPAMLNWVHTRLYSGQQGYKLQISDLQFSRWYQGPIDYQGFDHVTVTGDFGSAFRPLAIYRWGALVDPNRTIKMWPEFAKDPSVELRYVVSEVVQTQPDTVTRRRVFTGAALEHELALVGAPTYSLLNVTVEVRGTGKLQLGPVHCRWSRFELGEFFPGGERLVDPTDRGDLLFYFNPGDLRPPLNIYFSGFRPAEGFEAFYMMRSMRAPFILVADPRLSGGAFYLGSPALETGLKQKIQAVMDWLGFTPDQVNYSGASMGSYGAAYYGVQMQAHTILPVKLILNLGAVAHREMTYRFGGFPTSLDIVRKFSSQHDLSPASLAELDNRFWDQFKAADLSHTRFFVPYMQDDDYDLGVYQQLLRTAAQQHQAGQIIGRGFPGHHTDGSSQVIAWFKQQYRNILRDDFGRGGN